MVLTISPPQLLQYDGPDIVPLQKEKESKHKTERLDYVGLSDKLSARVIEIDNICTKKKPVSDDVKTIGPYSVLRLCSEMVYLQPSGAGIAVIIRESRWPIVST